MKKVLLVSLLVLTGCDFAYHLRPVDYEKAFTLCAPNDGLTSVNVSASAYEVSCNNGAKFDRNKTRAD